MIDFACKKFDIDEIIKCGFGLTRSEVKVFSYLIKNNSDFCSTDKISKSIKLDLTTIQKAMKKMYEKKIFNRRQKNLVKGGYVFEYKIKNKKEIRELIKNLVKNWSKSVEGEIDRW